MIELYIVGAVGTLTLLVIMSVVFSEIVWDIVDNNMEKFSGYIGVIILLSIIWFLFIPILFLVRTGMWIKNIAKDKVEKITDDWMKSNK